MVPLASQPARSHHREKARLIRQTKRAAAEEFAEPECVAIQKQPNTLVCTTTTAEYSAWSTGYCGGRRSL